MSEYYINNIHENNDFSRHKYNYLTHIWGESIRQEKQPHIYAMVNSLELMMANIYFWGGGV